MPRPMQHPHQAPRGTACNVACGTLLPLSTSRKHVPVTAGAQVHLRPGHEATERGRAWASRRARRGRVSAADVGAPRAEQPERDRSRRSSWPRTPLASPHPSGPAGRRCCCRRGMSIACSAWGSVSFSPRTTWTTDCPCRWSLARPPRRPLWHAGVSIHAPPTRRARSGPGLCPALAVRPASGSPCSTPARWAHGSGGSRSPMPLAARMTGQFNA
jgi:hypothetical protein